MTALPIQAYFATSLVMLGVGLYILSVKRNIVRILLGIETMINGAHLAFIVLSYWLTNGQVDPLIRSIVIISLGISSIIAALGISLVILVYRKFGTRDIRKLRQLKG